MFIMFNSMELRTANYGCGLTNAFSAYNLRWKPQQYRTELHLEFCGANYAPKIRVPYNTIKYILLRT